MICHVYKPKRRVNGKVVASRLYHGRYRLDDQRKPTNVSLGTSDKQVAKKRLQDIISELQQEQAGLIAPKAQRCAAGIELTRHVRDFATDLTAKGQSEKYIYNLGKRLAKVFEGCT